MRTRSLSASAALLAACLVAGYAASSEALHVPLVLSAVALALLILLSLNPGAFYGLLIVAVLNGLPLIDIQEFTDPGRFRPEDVLVIVLILALVVRISMARVRPLIGVLPKYLIPLAAFLFLWWTSTLLRTWLFSDVPLLQSALFAREYMYLALLVPLLALALQNRRDVFGLLSVLAAASVLTAVGIILSSITEDPVSALLHPTVVGETEGLTRLHLRMNEGVVALVPFGLGLVLFTQYFPRQLIGVALALLGLWATALTLTRATYIALPVAVLAVFLMWSRGQQLSARRARAALVAGLLTVTVAIFALAAAPASDDPNSPLAAVQTRISDTPQEVIEQSGTLGYRYELLGRLLGVLDGHWVAGLGFLHPDVHYVVGLPHGSLRQSDIGISSPMMTMGVIGTIGFYALLGVGLLRILSSRRESRSAGDDEWLRFGSGAWLLLTVIASVTVATLHTVPGVTLAAAVMAIGLFASAPVRHQ